MNKGDVVHIEYEMWVDENPPRLHDTNREEVAKANKQHDEERKYRPVAHIVGGEDFYQPIEDAIEKAKLGEEVEVTVQPGKEEKISTGERDGKLVELMPLRNVLGLPQYREKGLYPEVGDRVVINQRAGQIVSIAAGRVRVDFNPPLAGRIVRFRFRITDVAEKPEDKARGMIEREYAYQDDFKVRVKGQEAEIHLPEVCKYDLRWPEAKFRLVGRLRDSMGLKTIRFVEEWVAPKKKEEEREPGEKGREEGKTPGQKGGEKGKDQEEAGSEA
jgi:FKBP-type peptidyl-prolyl cis-trans isomerase 2